MYIKFNTRGSFFVICIFLAHRIRISEILPWDRKSYLTHAILPRLSREDSVHWLYWNSLTWSSSDVIVMLRIYHECEGRIEKSVPRMTVWHHAASPGMTNADHEGRIFLSYPHTNNNFLLI